jgi:hypothetical protein
MTNPIKGTGTAQAPVRLPMYESEEQMVKGEMSRPWVMWFDMNRRHVKEARAGGGAAGIVWTTIEGHDVDYLGTLDPANLLNAKYVKYGLLGKTMFINFIIGGNTLAPYTSYYWAFRIPGGYVPKKTAPLGADIGMTSTIGRCLVNSGSDWCCLIEAGDVDNSTLGYNEIDLTLMKLPGDTLPVSGTANIVANGSIMFEIV